MSGSTDDKGTRWETEVATYLNSWGFPVRRTVQSSSRSDMGDLEGLPDFTLQAKDHATFTLASWLDDVERQRKASAERYGAVVQRRRGKLTKDAYVIMTLETLAKLIATIDMERGFRTTD